MRALFVALLVGCSAAEGEPPAEVDAAIAEDAGAPGETSAGDAEPADSSADDTGVSPSDSAAGETSAGVNPPFGASSKGGGGPSPVNGMVITASGITYRMIAPAGGTNPKPLMIVFSGTEGGATMTNNLLSLRGMTGTSAFLFAVLDGKDYFDNGAAGATVLDDVRTKYDVDNDRTYLLGESAGTRASLKLGFRLRQSYFAAYWANDVNFADGPAQTSAELGFAPHGQAGPGGQLALATEIVTKMKAAGYRVPTPAPYDGPGSTTHGAPAQFIAAVSWFPGKTRK